MPVLTNSESVSNLKRNIKKKSRINKVPIFFSLPQSVSYLGNIKFQFQNSMLRKQNVPFKSRFSTLDGKPCNAPLLQRMGVEGLWVNIENVKILHCNQFYWYIPWVLPHFDKIPKSKASQFIDIALIANNMLPTQFQLIPLKTHALKQALGAWHLLFFPGPFNHPLSYLILHFLVSLQTSNTSLSFLIFSNEDLVHGENRCFQKRTYVSLHHHLFPLPAWTHTVCCSLCIKVQPVHLCLLSSAPFT